MREILLCVAGQSNQLGAAALEGGVVRVKATSSYLSQTDPFPGSNQLGQGGSMFPYLIDRARQRGVNYTIRNYAIGSASVDHYLGITGATVTGGSASTPAAQGYMGAVGLSGGSGIPAEGDADFDPFGLLSRARAAIVAANPNSFDAAITCWANGESDTGKTAVAYQARLEAIANYLLADGNVDAHFIGLSSKQAATSAANYDALQSGVGLAIAARQSAGKPVYQGGDLYAWYGVNPPLYPENDTTTRAHLTLRGQEVQAWRWDLKLASAGY